MRLLVFGQSRTLVCDGKRGELKHLMYPQEKKVITIPLVRATEKGTEQTECNGESHCRCGVWTWALPNSFTGSPLERGSIEGDRPVQKEREGCYQVSRVLLVEYRVGIRETITPNSKYNLSPIVN